MPNEATVGSTFPSITTEQLRTLKIPLPPLAEQEKIVAEIEAEQRLVEANRQLIDRMEQKIAATLARIWGEPEKDPIADATQPIAEQVVA